MKIKNIYIKDINVNGIPLTVANARTIKKETQEIKNLIKNKYIKMMKDE